jgi:hypothetical protein
LVRAATFLQRLFIGWNRSEGSDWFANLGRPSAIGTQNDLGYAVDAKDFRPKGVDEADGPGF